MRASVAARGRGGLDVRPRRARGGGLARAPAPLLRHQGAAARRGRAPRLADRRLRRARAAIGGAHRRRPARRARLLARGPRRSATPAFVALHFELFTARARTPRIGGRARGAAPPDPRARRGAARGKAREGVIARPPTPRPSYRPASRSPTAWRCVPADPSTTGVRRSPPRCRRRPSDRAALARRSQETWWRPVLSGIRSGRGSALVAALLLCAPVRRPESVRASWEPPSPPPELESCAALSVKPAAGRHVLRRASGVAIVADFNAGCSMSSIYERRWLGAHMVRGARFQPTSRWDGTPSRKVGLPAPVQQYPRPVRRTPSSSRPAVLPACRCGRRLNPDRPPPNQPPSPPAPRISRRARPTAAFVRAHPSGRVASSARSATARAHLAAPRTADGRNHR